jgi:PAS domain-containing protein
MGGEHVSLQPAIEPTAIFRALVASSPDAVIVADRHGRVTSMNPAAEAATGWGDSAARGERIQDICRLADVGDGAATAMTADRLFAGLDRSRFGTIAGRAMLQPLSGPDLRPGSAG